MTPEELFKQAQADLAALYGAPVTHQDIKNLITEMGRRNIQRRCELKELLEEKHREQVATLQKRCGVLGHIFDNERSYGVRCIVCDSPKDEAKQ